MSNIAEMMAAATDKIAELQDQVAELKALERDASNYRWLRERMLAVDFSYGDPPCTVLVFSFPDTPVGTDLDENIELARTEEG